MKYKRVLIIIICLLLSLPALTACSSLPVPADHGDLIYFEYYNYSKFGYYSERPTVYKAMLNGDQVLVEYASSRDDIDMVYVCDLSFWNELALLISENNLNAWDGFDETAEADDGSWWTMRIRYSDGQINATGDNAMPKDYFEKMEKLYELFSSSAATAKPYTEFESDSLISITGQSIPPINFSEGSIEPSYNNKQFFEEIAPGIPGEYLVDVKNSSHQIYREFFKSGNGNVFIDYDTDWITMDYLYNGELFTVAIGADDLSGFAGDLYGKLEELYSAYQIIV